MFSALSLEFSELSSEFSAKPLESFEQVVAVNAAELTVNVSVGGLNARPVFMFEAIAE